MLLRNTSSAINKLGLDPSRYTTAWFCRTRLEFERAKDALDEIHCAELGPHIDRLGHLSIFALGTIKDKHVVIASTHYNRDGRLAALTALSLEAVNAFPNLKNSIMATTGSGLPNETHDVRLGDVVVSKAEGEWNGVVDVSISEILPAQLTILPRQGAGAMAEGVAAAASFEAAVAGKQDNASTHLAALLAKNGDSMFPSEAVQREALHEPGRPRVHFGLVATRERDVEDAIYRDAIKRDTGACAFQVAADSLMDEYDLRPVVVVGVKNYADVHGTDEEWEKYAAVAAVACAKEIVERF